MSDDKPAREWWITGNNIVFDFEPSDACKIKQVTHVIEHAAYAKVCAELDHALAAASIHADEHRKARALLAEAEAALELADQWRHESCAQVIDQSKVASIRVRWFKAMDSILARLRAGKGGA